MFKYLLFLLLCTSVSAESLYFIEQGPRKNESPIGPHSCTIWKFDEENGKLKKIWELKESEWISSVMLYQKFKKILITTTSFYTYDNPDKFYLIPYDSLNKTQEYSTSKDSLIYDLRVYELKNSKIAVLINYNKPILRKVNMFQNVNNFNELENPVRMFGTKIHEQESSQVHINKDGSLRVFNDNTPKNLHFSLQTTEIPDDLFKLNKDKNGSWKIISIEPEYILIQSGKYLDENYREILLYKKEQKKWYSFLIPGFKTDVRVINDYITAIENGNDSLKNYQSCTFININTLEQSYVRLGKYPSILWVEDNGIVYYRYIDGIYKGLLNSGLLENRKLIYKSNEILGLCWGFKGKE